MCTGSWSMWECVLLISEDEISGSQAANREMDPTYQGRETSLLQTPIDIWKALEHWVYIHRMRTTKKRRTGKVRGTFAKLILFPTVLEKVSVLSQSPISNKGNCLSLTV